MYMISYDIIVKEKKKTKVAYRDDNINHGIFTQWHIFQFLENKKG